LAIAAITACNKGVKPVTQDVWVPDVSKINWQRPWSNERLTDKPWTVNLAGGQYICDVASYCARCQRVNDPYRETLLFCKTKRYKLPVVIGYSVKVPSKGMDCKVAEKRMNETLSPKGWSKSQQDSSSVTWRAIANPDTHLPAVDVTMECEGEEIEYWFDRAKPEKTLISACASECSFLTDQARSNCCNQCSQLTKDQRQAKRSHADCMKLKTIEPNSKRSMIGKIVLRDRANQVVVKDNMAIIGTRNLELYDVTNPSKPSPSIKILPLSPSKNTNSTRPPTMAKSE
jgi:hypothetical protein